MADELQTVRRSTAGDIDAMRDVGIAAGERFRTIDDARIARCADHEPFELSELAAYVDAGRAWVAVEGDHVVGFAVVDLEHGEPHLEEVSVHPARQGRGHGLALLDHVRAWAVAHGHSSVTLTTFRDVPWNRPYYERRGYRVLAEDELTASLRARVDEEHALGLDRDLRVVMRLDL